MTVAKMRKIWVTFCLQVVPHLKTPGMAVGLVSHGYPHQEWQGLCYQSGLIIVKPWAARWTVIHEYCHWLFWNADIEHRPEGGAFLEATGGGSWDYTAMERFASTLCGVLCGTWRYVPVRRAAFTLKPLVTDQAWAAHVAREAKR